MRYLTILILGAGLFTGLFWAMPAQQSPPEYMTYTVQQPRCSAAEAGDLTTFEGKGVQPFRAVCSVSDGQWFWNALPNPAYQPQPVCGPASHSWSAYCPATEWRNW